MWQMAILLKAARINAEKTQEEAGEYVGKSKVTIGNYESYSSKPDVETAKKLAEFYGLTVDDIIWSK
jgi:DNA-binding XRE family transcriptional regulator